MKKGVMIVGAGVMQVPAILKAKELGLFVIATDRNPDAPGFKFADERLVLDIKDVSGHVEYARANKERFNISGAFAGADVAITVASIADSLGLPGIPVDVAIRSNNKWLMKKRWLEDGIATPYAEEVASIEEGRKALKKTGLPAMVKAIDNAASRGSRKITSLDELPMALEDAKDHSTTKTALIEELVSGAEQSVELIVHNGLHRRFGVVDRHFGFEPFPIEIGHTNPSALSKDVQDSLFDLTERAARSLGIEFGPYKSDTMLTDKGPVVLELPARLSGGFHSQYTTPLALGLDPIKAAISLCVGMGFPEECARQKRNRAAVCKAIFPEPGEIVSIEGVEDAKKTNGVEEVFLMVSPGDVILPYKNCANRVCYVIATGFDQNEALYNWEKGADAIRIKTRPIIGKDVAAC